jgi:hypothetical protein
MRKDRINYNWLKRQLHNTLANTRNLTFEQYITPLSKDDHKIWKATKIQTTPNINTSNKEEKQTEAELKVTQKRPKPLENIALKCSHH